MILASAVLDCLCGPVFDIADTPNLKARLDEAGLRWPPTRVIDYPANPWQAASPVTE